jgi:L-seryl-tRNA(Ser) seleniumtransferase
MRVDKMTIAALAATLELYRDRERALREIPALSMIVADATDIRSRCEHAVSELGRVGVSAEVTESEASIGAGAFPVYAIPSFSVRLHGVPDALQRRLREAATPVIGRIADGYLNLDLRSVPARFDRDLIAAVHLALN